MNKTIPKHPGHADKHAMDSHASGASHPQPQAVASRYSPAPRLPTLACIDTDRRPLERAP